MPLSLKSVDRISRSMARDEFPGVSVNGVSSADLDKSRVEVLITAATTDQPPARLTVNVTRSDQASFESEFRSKLAAALADAASLKT